jgi:hypothetical protein
MMLAFRVLLAQQRISRYVDIAVKSNVFYSIRDVAPKLSRMGRTSNESRSLIVT